MHIPATLLFLAVLYMVFQSVLIAGGLLAAFVLILYALFILVTKDSAKAKGYLKLSLIGCVVPCIAIVVDLLNH